MVWLCSLLLACSSFSWYSCLSRIISFNSYDGDVVVIITQYHHISSHSGHDTKSYATSNVMNNPTVHSTVPVEMLHTLSVVAIDGDTLEGHPLSVP